MRLTHRTGNRTLLLAPFAAAAGLLLAGCATPGSPGAPGQDPPPAASESLTPGVFGASAPAAPSEEVVGTGYVVDAGNGPQLCLGAVAASSPPQCGGPPIAGWDWNAVAEIGDESSRMRSSGDTTWGQYTLTGRWDGATFTVTDVRPPEPADRPAPEPPADPVDEDTLKQVQQTVKERIDAASDAPGGGYLSIGTARDHVVVDVLWDDGTYQAAADAEFGDGVVQVNSALQPAG